MPDPITITQDATPPVQEEVIANLEAEAADAHEGGQGREAAARPAG